MYYQYLTHVNPTDFPIHIKKSRMMEVKYDMSICLSVLDLPLLTRHVTKCLGSDKNCNQQKIKPKKIKTSEIHHQPKFN